MVGRFSRTGVHTSAVLLSDIGVFVLVSAVGGGFAYRFRFAKRMNDLSISNSGLFTSNSVVGAMGAKGGGMIIQTDSFACCGPAFCSGVALISAWRPWFQFGVRWIRL